MAPTLPPPPQRVIIDTDPGVDDILALLLAFSARPEELEVLLVSLTFGNVEVDRCVRNVISLFHFIAEEQKFRLQNGFEEGFETLRSHKPIVAIGAKKPLADQQMMADYFHGRDGLGDIGTSHPHLSPKQTWEEVIRQAQSSRDRRDSDAAEEAKAAMQGKDRPRSLFVPSTLPAHEEIIRVLQTNDPGTVTVIAIGPCTNLAMAAARDPEAFLRAKEVVIMGGTLKLPGNITPVGEFNVYADSIAAARIFALTSPTPISTMPPIPPVPSDVSKSSLKLLQPYPPSLSRKLRLILFSLDITTDHVIGKDESEPFLNQIVASGSPLAEWASAFLTSTFATVGALHKGPVTLSLHDPLCIWYALSSTNARWKLQPGGPEDIRIETSGQWTRGMCVVDGRDRKMLDEDELAPGEVAEFPKLVPSDADNWLSRKYGNRIHRVVESPDREGFGMDMLRRIFQPGRR